MAVWIYAYGRNGLLNESKSKEDYLAILNSIPLDEVKLLDPLFPRASDSNLIVKLSPEEKLNHINFYKSLGDGYKTMVEQSGAPANITVEDFVDYIYEQRNAYLIQEKQYYEAAYRKYKDGSQKSLWKINGDLFQNELIPNVHYGPDLKFSSLNDLFQIQGPFDIFSHYGRFQKDISLEAREYYHDYFKAVFRAFKSDFILYAHEWSGMDDEDNEEFDYAALKEQSNWEVNSSTSIHNMDRFYYEKL